MLLSEQAYQLVHVLGHTRDGIGQGEEMVDERIDLFPFVSR